MGIDLATWRARIGLNYYRQCRYACQSLRIQWRAARWGVREVVNSTPLVLQGCMAVVSLSLILEYAFHKWGGCPKWKGGCGKVRCPKFGGGSVLCADKHTQHTHTTHTGYSATLPTVYSFLPCNFPIFTHSTPSYLSSKLVPKGTDHYQYSHYPQQQV